MEPLSLHFDKGTLVLRNLTPAALEHLDQVRWDSRVRQFRAPAYAYRDIVLTLRNKGIGYEDHAKQFEPLTLHLKKPITPRPYQKEAVKSWLDQGQRGVVVLPTGAGKTVLAVLLMNKIGRPTLVHVPTIDLMMQWREVLQRFFDQKIGFWGGGRHELEPITITTYDSAILHVDHYGNRFGFVIFDECHHLPSDRYQHAALASPAPFRLGLTATPERADGRDRLLDQLCGPEAYRIQIHDLTGGTLAPFEFVTLEIDMNAEERVAYEQERKIYSDYLRKAQIDFRQPGGWQQFIWKCSRSEEGKRAFQAYLSQKKLSQASEAKEAQVWALLCKHREDQVLVFTQDNEMAYRLGRRFLQPVLTHLTRPKEREAFLDHYRKGTYRMLITSKVLNEGVDVPEANVAIVVSGSGSVREHVQRLGRILRGRPGKQAILYELVAKDTGETHVSKRRKRHHAYQGPGSV